MVIKISRPIHRLAIISSQAFSLVNFRGPLIRALANAEIEVFTFAPDFDEELRSAIIKLGAKPISYHLSRTGLNPLRDLADIVRLSSLLKNVAPDATLAYFIKPVIYGSIASWQAGIPLRYSLIEGLGFAYTSPDVGHKTRRLAIRLLVTALYRVALTRNRKVFFLNDDDIKDFRDRRIVRSEQVVKLDGIGVDLAEFRLAPAFIKPITFLMMGRLLRDKGVYEFVEAARTVRRQFANVRFILLGSTDANPSSVSLRELQCWNDEKIVEWHGHCSDVRPWLSQTSVFVLPSYREGLPRSTQEAMAMGRPVITTDTVGCRDTVENGRNGFLVPTKDVEALSTAMLRFIHEPNLIARMGLESRAIAEARFDVHRINRRIMSELGILEPALIPSEVSDSG